MKQTTQVTDVKKAVSFILVTILKKVFFKIGNDVEAIGSKCLNPENCIVKTGNDVYTTRSRTRVILSSKSIGAFFRSNKLVDFSIYDTQISYLTGATVKHP